MATDYTVRPFTNEEFMLAWEAGAFGEDNVELLDGEVILMPPVGEGHDFSIERWCFRKARSFSGRVRCRNPISRF